MYGLGTAKGPSFIPMSLARTNSTQVDIKWLAAISEKADAGDPFFQTALGVAYIYGHWGLAKDAKKGMQLVESASEAGYYDASCKLGILYYAPGIPAVDVDIGLKYYELAVAQGSPIAAHNLGCFHRSGKGVPRDEAKAFAYFQFAATNDLAVACRDLAIAYHEGQGTQKDRIKALAWFERAVSLGDDGSTNWLAFYFDRPGGATTTEILDNGAGGTLLRMPRKQEVDDAAAVPDPEQAKVLAGLVDYMPEVSGGSVLGLRDPDDLASAIMYVSPTFHPIPDSPAFANTTFTEVQLNAHEAGADGIRFETPVGDPRSWTLAMAVPNRSIYAICLVRYGSIFSFIGIDRIPAATVQPRGWPPDYDVLFIDLSFDGKLFAGAEYYLAIVPLDAHKPVRAWLALQSATERLHVNGGPVPSLRNELWESAFNLAHTDEPTSGFLRGVFSLDPEVIRSAVTNRNDLTRLWDARKAGLSFAVALSDSTNLLTYLLAQQLDFDVPFAPDRSRVWDPESIGMKPVERAIGFKKNGTAMILMENGFKPTPGKDCSNAFR